jgi:hypothetical protein
MVNTFAVAPSGLTLIVIPLFPRVETLGYSPSPLRGYQQAQKASAILSLIFPR